MCDKNTCKSSHCECDREEVKIGDPVKWGVSNIATYEIQAIIDGVAWIRNTETNGNFFATLNSLKKLRPKQTLWYVVWHRKTEYIPRSVAYNEERKARDFAQGVVNAGGVLVEVFSREFTL